MSNLSNRIPVTIPAGQSLSNAVDLGPGRVQGFAMPAVWTAAGLSFQVSLDGENYLNLYDAGTERTIAADVNRFISENVTDWLGVRWLKVRSGTAGTPVNQVAAATILIAIDP